MTKDDARRALFAGQKVGREPERMRAFEEAVRRADLEQDEELQYVARVKLMHSAMAYGELERAVAVMGACITGYEKNPEGRRRGMMIRVTGGKSVSALGYNFLTDLRSLLGILHLLPDLERERIDAACEQAERLHRPFPQLLGYLIHVRCVSCRWMGDETAGRELERRWRREWERADVQGPGCTTCKELPLRILDRDGDACGRIADLLLADRLGRGCGRIMPLLAVQLLLPLCLLDRHEDAARLFPMALGAVRRGDLPWATVHLLIPALAVCGEFEAGWRLAQEAGEKCRWTARRYPLLLALGLLVEAALVHGGPRRLPRPFPGGPEILDVDAEAGADGLLDTEGLLPRIREAAAELGRRYDARNGNTWRTERARRDREEALASFRPVPLRE